MAAAARTSSSPSSFDSTHNDIVFYGPKKLLGTGWGGLEALARKLIWDQTACLAATRMGAGSSPKLTLCGPRQNMEQAKELAKIYINVSQQGGRCQHYLPDTPGSDHDYSQWIEYTRRQGISVRKRKAVSAPPGLQQRVRK